MKKLLLSCLFAFSVAQAIQNSNDPCSGDVRAFTWEHLEACCKNGSLDAYYEALQRSKRETYAQYEKFMKSDTKNEVNTHWRNTHAIAMPKIFGLGIATGFLVSFFLVPLLSKEKQKIAAQLVGFGGIGLVIWSGHQQWKAGQDHDTLVKISDKCWQEASADIHKTGTFPGSMLNF